jgi:hypothetical protein
MDKLVSMGLHFAATKNKLSIEIKDFLPWDLNS